MSLWRIWHKTTKYCGLQTLPNSKSGSKICFLLWLKQSFLIQITYVIDLLVYTIITNIRYYCIFQNITTAISKRICIILITDNGKWWSDTRTTCVKVLGRDLASTASGRSWRVVNVSFCTRKGQRDARGIYYQEGRTIQGFEPPIIILNI